MNLTKTEAIENHRKMWRWLAEETEKRERKVEKKKYFEEHGIEDTPANMCYCCEYARRSLSECGHCPIDWPRGGCSCWLYSLWCGATDYHEAAELARQIAELPVKGGLSM